jgi:hypothetical protein
MGSVNTGPTGVTDITSGSGTVLVNTPDGLYSAGAGESGQLGIGGSDDLWEWTLVTTYDPVSPKLIRIII